MLGLLLYVFQNIKREHSIKSTRNRPSQYVVQPKFHTLGSKPVFATLDKFGPKVDSNYRANLLQHQENSQALTRPYLQDRTETFEHLRDKLVSRKYKENLPGVVQKCP